METQGTRALVITGAYSMAVAVILGALGAHALENQLTTDQLDSFKTGVRYQAWHSLALLFLGISGRRFLSRKQVKSIATLFILGISMFSFSIYLLSCKSILGIENWTTFLGPITPAGGLSLILGWIVLGSKVAKQKNIG